ncbi:hypothetical protein B5M42_014015 [Paenibacillus athensensis]|uniref:Uncharacterized protein n=1 Tax=Paenibacillus athensensis TaxID=1967502 RepID=A0A4Y8PXP4_9BACL|nr:hypothetical protein [Paenibacillus athensensis]MCD1259948.1 hypothetical protein [Paenibacillus athensensis]
MLLASRHFDLNEWFLIGVTLLEIALFLALRKRFSLLIKVIVLGFNFFLSQAVDFVIAVKPLDLYDVNDGPEYEWLDLMLYVLTYPLEAYLVMVVYDRLQPKGWSKMGFIWGMAFMTLGFEGIAVWFDVYTYKGWNLYESLFVYAGVYGLNVALFDFVRSPRSSGRIAAGRMRRAD